MSSRLAAVLLALACASTRVPSAQAEPNPAEDQRDELKTKAASLDRAAREAFAAGSFARAAELFAEANATLPHPATIYNEAIAWQRAGELARAANALVTALEQLPADDARSRDARQRLNALSERLGRLMLSTSEPATASVAFVHDRRAPWAIYLEPGNYIVQVKFEHGARQRPFELRAGEALRLEIDAPLAPRLAPPVAAVPPPSLSSRSPWGVVALGAGAAAGVAAGVLGYSTLRARDDFERSGDTDRGARERALELRAFTNVALGASLAASTLGLYLLLRRDAARPSPGVALGVGWGRAVVSARF